MMTPRKPPGQSVLPDDARPCVWMAAGLVHYKLCDRDFDCEHCPLDAALRGRPVPPPLVHASLRHIPWIFPDDRRYGSTHVWVKPVPMGRLRLGIDAFAAGLLVACRRVSLPAPGTSLARGERLAHLDAYAGLVSLNAPLPCRMQAANTALEDDPEIPIVDPYEAGWLAEVTPAAARSELTRGDLLTASDMLQRARADMQRFRRRVAMHLLDGTAEVGPAMADGGEVLSDLRLMLGTERYCKLINEALG